MTQTATSMFARRVSADCRFRQHYRPSEFSHGLHGFSQSQAASVLGIPISDVESYEREENRSQNKPSTIPKAIQRACNAFDRKSELLSALRSKIKDKLRSDGPPGHITPEILREILLEIVDVIQMEKSP